MTALLERIASGEHAAEEDLFAVLEKELRALARSKLGLSRSDQTLQLTALVHEAWIRLTSPGAAGARGREHFLAVAAQAMRCVLVDHARERNAAKRSGPYQRVPLDDAIDSYEARSGDLVDLDLALERLAVIRPRQARIVELRFFGGLTAEETARVLGIGRATVMRDWHLARMRLRAELGDS